MSEKTTDPCPWCGELTPHANDLITSRSQMEEAMIRSSNELFETKQRYEQLEQLTRRLCRYIKKDADESWSPVKEKIARLFQEELEALGVRLDD